MSPFMLGPYYKPQLTSMLSITHRLTGVALTFGAFLLAWWLLAIAAGPSAYAVFSGIARGIVGQVVLIGLTFCLVYHFLNGIRHLLWDIGWGLEIPTTYKTGWAVVVLSVLGTAIVAWLGFGGGAV
jgi:succinate dehydrogenase / fumarate reductase cytochrome b subunit